MLKLKNKIFLLSRLAACLLSFSPSITFSANCGSLPYPCSAAQPFCCSRYIFSTGVINACPVSRQDWSCSAAPLSPATTSTVCRNGDRVDEGWKCTNTGLPAATPTPTVAPPTGCPIATVSHNFTYTGSQQGSKSSAGPCVTDAGPGRCYQYFECTPGGSAPQCTGNGYYRTVNFCDSDNTLGTPISCSGFSFAIPNTATILGLSASVYAWDQGASASPGSLVNVGLLSKGSLLAFKNVNAALGKIGAYSAYTYGGSTDLWGVSLTPAVVNDSSFGLQMLTRKGDQRIFHGTKPGDLTIKIWYQDVCSTPTPAASPTPTGPTPTPTPTPGPPIVVLTTPLNFGFNDVLVGDTSDPQNFTFQNTGGVDATNCKAVWKTGTADFTILADGCATIGKNGGTCTVTVGGKPLTTGAKSSAIGVTCGNFAGPTNNGDVSEVGQTLPILQPLNPAQHIFGPLVSGATASIPVAIANAGTLKAKNCVVDFGSDTTHFAADTGCSDIPSTGCNFTATGKADAFSTGASYNTTYKITCSGVYSTTAKYTTINYSANPGFTASSDVNKYEVDTGCSADGAFKTAANTCQCPVGYEITDIFGGKKGCRPKFPSKDYLRQATSAAQLDGYPVCGDNRFPVDASFKTANYSQFWLPKYSDVVTGGGNTYPFASGTNTVPPAAPAPTYIYQNLTRCVCNTNGSGGNAAVTNVTAATVAQLSDTLPSGLPRFVPDYLEVIAPFKASDATTAPVYSEVAIASVPNVYGASGQVYQATQSRCGCPNFNEYSDSLDPGHTLVAGSVCKPMLDLSDAKTKQYKILTKYNPAIHVDNVQKFSDIGKSETSFNLPQQSGGNASYTRRIWNCAPPFELKKVGTTLTCVFNAADNLCDDGTGGGGPSAVSVNASSAGSTALPTSVAYATAKFKNTVNKRLACCTNVFDPRILGVKEKFDCVENSTVAYADFDTLWKSSTEGLPNGILLSSSSGIPVSGFYTLAGTRCSEFNEFAGKIQYATVNPLLVSSQQNLAGATKDVGKIQTIDKSIAQPDWVKADASWSKFVAGKSVPTTAEQMRRCPILVRAAIETECPYDGVSKPTNGNAYPALPNELQTYNDNGTIRCSAAAKVQVRMKVEQVYTITGSKPMSPIDSVTDASQAINVQVGDWIKSKSAGNCPSGATRAADGSCVFQ